MKTCCGRGLQTDSADLFITNAVFVVDQNNSENHADDNMANRGEEGRPDILSPLIDCNRNSLKESRHDEAFYSDDILLPEPYPVCRTETMLSYQHAWAPSYFTSPLTDIHCKCSSSCHYNTKPFNNQTSYRRDNHNRETSSELNSNAQWWLPTTNDFPRNDSSTPSQTHDLRDGTQSHQWTSPTEHQVANMKNITFTLPKEEAVTSHYQPSTHKTVASYSQPSHHHVSSTAVLSSGCSPTSSPSTGLPTMSPHLVHSPTRTLPVHNGSSPTLRTSTTRNHQASITQDFTFDLPAIVVVNDDDDNSDIDVREDRKTPVQEIEQYDHTRLCPYDADNAEEDVAAELNNSLSYRIKPNVFTFDNITEESEDTITEGSMSPPPRRVSFSRPVNPSLESDEDKVSDLVTLKAMTARLNLTTRRQSYIAWKEEYLDKPLLARYRPQTSHAGGNEWSPERKEEINNAIQWLKRELLEMKKSDQELARILVTLRHEIRQMKLQKTCSEHREMLDDLHDQMAERGEMSELCDLPTDPMSPAPLKNVGVTRMNISTRRFSVF